MGRRVLAVVSVHNLVDFEWNCSNLCTNLATVSLMTAVLMMMVVMMVMMMIMMMMMMMVLSVATKWPVNQIVVQRIRKCCRIL